MSGNSADDSAIEAALDQLYCAPHAEFVTRRDALAKRLRLEGAAEAARRVKALRKPSAVPWAINRLHLESDGLVPLREASRSLRAALSGEHSADERRAAIDARRRAVASVTASVVALLEEAGVSGAPALLRRIERSLLAIAATGTGAGSPVPGRLDRELEPPGIEAVLDLPAPTPSGSRSDAARANGAGAGTTVSGTRRRPAARLEAGARPAARRAARPVDPPRQPPGKPVPKQSPGRAVASRQAAREAAARSARRALDEAEADLERATAKLDQARERATEAAKSLEGARREAEAARRELAATRARRDERRRALAKALADASPGGTEAAPLPRRR